MAGGERGSEQGLMHYFRVLGRRRKVFILVVLAIVAPAVTVSLLQTPLYTATAKVLVQPSSREALFESSGGLHVTDPRRALQTQVEVLEGSVVKQAVRQRLGSTPEVSVTPVIDADVLEVDAEDPDARRAAEVANAYVAAYIDVRRQQAVDDTRAAIEEIGAKIHQLRTQIDELDRQIASAAPEQREAVRQTITPQRDALLAQQSLFSQRFDQLQVEVALQTGGARVVSVADPPRSPSSPKPVQSGILALVAGLVLAGAVTLVLDRLDDTIKTKEDLGHAVPGIPVIGMIPASAEMSRRAEVASATRPTSATAEAYRTLRTSIQFLSVDRTVRTLQVTSPSSHEGKTTTVANMGVAMARSGLRVVVVECDLRRPRLHQFFGVDNSVGFTSVLLRTPVADALQEVPGEKRLRVLPSGPLPPNPSELLSTRRTQAVLTALAGEVDIVLIDCPPILPVTDALILSRQVDATVLVTIAGVTTRSEAARAAELLQQVNAPLVGTVLNGVTGVRSGYEYYGSGSPQERLVFRRKARKERTAVEEETTSVA